MNQRGINSTWNLGLSSLPLGLNRNPLLRYNFLKYGVFIIEIEAFFLGCSESLKTRVIFWCARVWTFHSEKIYVASGKTGSFERKPGLKF